VTAVAPLHPVNAAIHPVVGFRMARLTLIGQSIGCSPTLYPGKTRNRCIGWYQHRQLPAAIENRIRQRPSECEFDGRLPASLMQLDLLGRATLCSLTWKNVSPP